MIITQTLQYLRLVRMRDCALYFQTQLPEPAADYLKALIAALTSLAALAGSQHTAAGRSRDLARAKRAARDTLRADLAAVHRVAAAAAFDTPGLDEKFRKSQRGDASLIATARSFAELALSVPETFTTPLGGSFLKDLNKHIQVFERSTQQYADGSRAATDVGAAIRQAMDEAVAAATYLDAIIRHTLQSDPEKIVAWDRACLLGRGRQARSKAATAAPAATEPVTPAAETAA